MPTEIGKTLQLQIFYLEREFDNYVIYYLKLHRLHFDKEQLNEISINYKSNIPDFIIENQIEILQ